MTQPRTPLDGGARQGAPSVPVLLVADPDTAGAEALAEALEREGVAVTGVSDGAQALIQTVRGVGYRLLSPK